MHTPQSMRSQRPWLKATRGDAHPAAADVLSDADLISHILRGYVGPSTFVAASRVCKTWHHVCRSDEVLLRRVALYQGGVTKSIFCGLFAVSPTEATALPHSTRHRARGGAFFVYREEAIAKTLADGGVPALRARIAQRARNVASGRSISLIPYHTLPRSCQQQAKLEDRLHARALASAG